MPDRQLRATPTSPLSVVVPAYNEASRLADSVDRITHYLRQRAWTHEVLIVDDGSDDETARSIRGLIGGPTIRLLTHERNLGKGAAVRTGVLASRGEWVLVTDADLSTPIEEIEKLADASAAADLVYGSRALPESYIEVHQARSRELLGRFFNFFVRRLLGLTDLHDTQCGFKLLRGNTARNLFAQLRILRYAFDVELAWLATRAGCAVREVPVLWRNSDRSSVRPLRDGLRMVVDLLWLRFRYLGHVPVAQTTRPADSSIVGTQHLE